MQSLAFVATAATLVLAAGLLGLSLRHRLPDEHGPDRARDMIGAMTGLLGLLLALVLGALVGSSYTVYATQKSELEMMAAKALQLDEALAAFGPEADPGARVSGRRSRRAIARSGANPKPISAGCRSKVRSRARRRLKSSCSR